MKSPSRLTTSVPIPQACTCARLRKLTRRMTSFYEIHMRQVGIKLSQYSVLANISDEAQTLVQLADRLEMDRTTLTRSLKPLVDKGWVAEIAGPDARQRLLVLTAEGQVFRAQAHARWRDAQLAIEAQLGRDFVTNLNAELEQVLSQLKPVLAEAN